MNKKKIVLICGVRPWSLINIQPVIDKMKDEIDFIIWDLDIFEKLLFNFNKLDLIITTEPDHEPWMAFYPLIKGKIPVLALQQSIYFKSNKKELVNQKYFDKYMVWGEQMKQCLLFNGHKKDTILVTGCPYHDHMFTCDTYRGDYDLVLEGGGKTEKIDDYTSNKEVIKVCHPNKHGYKVFVPTKQLIQYANKVLCHTAGCGLWALIMKKDCKIYGKSEKYLGWESSDFVKRVTTDNRGTERVIKTIKEFLN